MPKHSIASFNCSRVLFPLSFYMHLQELRMVLRSDDCDRSKLVSTSAYVYLQYECLLVKCWQIWSASSLLSVSVTTPIELYISKRSTSIYYQYLECMIPGTVVVLAHLLIETALSTAACSVGRPWKVWGEGVVLNTAWVRTFLFVFSFNNLQ